ncbi:hypothetical protein YC2023_001278 [Brassica napus]
MELLYKATETVTGCWMRGSLTPNMSRDSQGGKRGRVQGRTVLEIQVHDLHLRLLLCSSHHIMEMTSHRAHSAHVILENLEIFRNMEAIRKDRATSKYQLSRTTLSLLEDPSSCNAPACLRGICEGLQHQGKCDRGETWATDE